MPRNELEAAIFENPDDLDAWSAYAGWLEAAGDVRGELVRLDLGREEAGEFERRRIARRIDEITGKHQEDWMGPELANLCGRAEKSFPRAFEDVLQLDWRYGFIDTVRVATFYEWQGPAPAEVLRGVLHSPSARFLRKLAVGNLLDENGEADYSPLVQTIAQVGKLHALREVHIGDFEYPDDCEISWAEIGDVSGLYPAAPGLEKLHLRGAEIGLGQLRHARLRQLTLETGGLPAAAVRAVAAAELPELVDLEVWFGSSDYGAGGEVGMLEPILSGQRFAKLERLGLMNSELADDIARALPDSAILSRIQRLDLSMGTMTDAGGSAIANDADKFRHLEKLDLTDNYLTTGVAAQLTWALGDVVDARGQKKPDEWDGELHYHVSVDE